MPKKQFLKLHNPALFNFDFNISKVKTFNDVKLILTEMRLKYTLTKDNVDSFKRLKRLLVIPKYFNLKKTLEMDKKIRTKGDKNE